MLLRPTANLFLWLKENLHPAIENKPPRPERPAGNLLMSLLSGLLAESLQGDTNEHSLLNVLETHVDCQPLQQLGEKRGELLQLPDLIAFL